MPEAEKDLNVLRERAEAMAAPAREAPGAGEAAEFLEFILSGESYAVRLGLVREVCSGREIARVPGAPAFMEGVANIRGQILPVADLARLFGLGPAPEKPREIVILHTDGPEPRELGILADAIAGVRHLPAARIQPPPPGFSGLRAQYLGGVTDDGLVIFLAEKFLEERYK